LLSNSRKSLSSVKENPVPVAVEFQGGIQDAWSSVAAFVPKLVAALVILIVGYFVAKLIARILNTVLERVGFDRAVERGGIKQALARSKYDASDIVAKLAFWTIFLLVLQLAFGVFGPNPVSDLLKGLIAYLPNVVVAILILVIAAAIARAVHDLLQSLLGTVQGGQLLAKGAAIAILVFGVFAALDQLKIAPRIVTGLWYALLAALVGSVIVAVGGGGIRTMQRYWERAAGRAEEQGPRLRQQVQQSAQTSTYEPVSPGPAGASAADDLGGAAPRRRFRGR
jgi:hypothetical protein